MKEQEQARMADNISVVAMNVFDFHLKATEEFANNPEKVEGVELKVAKDIAYSLDQGMSRYRLYIECEGMRSEQEPIGIQCKLGVEFHFHISSIDKFVRNEDSEMKIDVALGYTLMSIAYSTARGILFEKTIGSYFRGIILPVVDPKEMLLAEEDGKYQSET